MPKTIEYTNGLFIFIELPSDGMVASAQPTPLLHTLVSVLLSLVVARTGPYACQRNRWARATE